MPFTPNQYLNNTSNVLLRDQQHAARTFVDDQFRLAPKHKFLFHVAFNINIGALRNIDLVQRHRNEINMLVKSCTLPQFSITAETLNQYNRKKNIQTTHKHNPIEITFHDDNMGIINQLWQNYYKYYYADPVSADDPNAYRRNATKGYSFMNNNYGLDNGSLAPFFNYITVYQMARHEYVSYKLLNPIITNWNHNKVDYGQTGVHDNQMQIAYEAVAYNVGEVSQGDPDGFALEHYDQTPSPLQLGDGGALTTAQPTFGSTNTTINTTSILSNVAKTVNSYQNTPLLSGTGLTSIITNPNQTSVPSITGLQGITFPSATSNTTTVALPRQLGT
jgi:hypothetical protein